jgi:hypothetical protein
MGRAANELDEKSTHLGKRRTKRYIQSKSDKFCQAPSENLLCTQEKKSLKLE